MTEREWLKCTNPKLMLEFIRNQHGERDKWGRRKVRLFACACVEPILPLIGPLFREAVEASAKYADGRIPYQEYRTAWKAGVERGGIRSQGFPQQWWSHLALVASNPEIWSRSLQLIRKLAAGGDDHQPVRTSGQQIVMLRDLFGNPFRPASLFASWLTPTVVSIARRIYDEKDFAALPILADALEDAGCDNADILDHLRGPGPHVRGCWVLDLLLDRK